MFDCRFSIVRLIPIVYFGPQIELRQDFQFSNRNIQLNVSSGHPGMFIAECQLLIDNRKSAIGNYLSSQMHSQPLQGGDQALA